MNLWTSEKCLNFIIFKKMQKKCSMDLGKTFPASNFLKSVTSRHCSNDRKEANILDRCGLPLNWGGINLGVFNTAIYGKIVQCSFKSFEQCIFFRFRSSVGTDRIDSVEGRNTRSTPIYAVSSRSTAQVVPFDLPPWGWVGKVTSIDLK